MMLNLALLFLSVVAVVRGQQDVMPTVKLTVSEQVVSTNTSVQFTCTLTGFSHDSVVNFAKEVLVGLPVQPIREIVSQSTVLTEAYRPLTRFSIERHIIGQDLQYLLKINGVTKEDSGSYICGAFHNVYGQINAAVTFEVYRPPNAQVNLNDTYTINEEEVLPLECLSTGALPIPAMEIWITDSDKPSISPHAAGSGANPLNQGSDQLPTWNQGGQLGRLIDAITRWRNMASEKWRHVTEDFLVSDELKPHCNDMTASKSCPLHYDYDVTATRSNFKPTFIHDEKAVTCFAYMRQLSRDFASDSVVLDVRYKPKILCPGLEDGKSVVTRNGTEHKIACRVLANPPLASLTVGPSWAWSAAPCKETGQEISADNVEYKTGESQVTGNKKQRTLSLEWKQPVKAEHFNKIYCLRVSNELGVMTKEFQLTESVSSAGGIRSSAWFVCLVAELLLVTCMLSTCSH